MGVIDNFSALKAAVKMYVVLKGFLQDPLVFKFFEHVTEVTTFTDIDNRVWEIIQKVLRLELVGDAEVTLAQGLDEIQAEVDAGTLTATPAPVPE